MTNRKIGRPKKIVRRADFPRVTALAAQGHSIAKIAEQFGMGARVFRARMAEDEKLRDAFEAGRAVEEEAIVNSMHQQATDPTNPRSVAAGKFLLQSRHGYMEGPCTQVNVQHNTLKISFPKAVPLKDLPEQAAALIEGKADG